METARTEREQAQIQMFGITTERMEQLFGDFKNPQFIAMSILSDVQEMIERGDNEYARQSINRVKWLIDNKMRG